MLGLGLGQLDEVRLSADEGLEIAHVAGVADEEVVFQATEHLRRAGVALAGGAAVKLAVDAANEKFVDNANADAMLTRDYRAPFVVPPAGQV